MVNYIKPDCKLSFWCSLSWNNKNIGGWAIRQSFLAFGALSQSNRGTTTTTAPDPGTLKIPWKTAQQSHLKAQFQSELLEITYERLLISLAFELLMIYSHLQLTRPERNSFLGCLKGSGSKRWLVKILISMTVADSKRQGCGWSNTNGWGLAVI